MTGLQVYQYYIFYRTYIFLILRFGNLFHFGSPPPPLKKTKTKKKHTHTQTPTHILSRTQTHVRANIKEGLTNMENVHRRCGKQNNFVLFPDNRFVVILRCFLVHLHHSSMKNTFFHVTFYLSLSSPSPYLSSSLSSLCISMKKHYLSSSLCLSLSRSIVNLCNSNCLFLMEPFSTYRLTLYLSADLVFLFVSPPPPSLSLSVCLFYSLSYDMSSSSYLFPLWPTLSAKGNRPGIRRTLPGEAQKQRVQFKRRYPFINFGIMIS